LNRTLTTKIWWMRFSGMEPHNERGLEK